MRRLILSIGTNCKVNNEINKTRIDTNNLMEGESEKNNSFIFGSFAFNLWL